MKICLISLLNYYIHPWIKNLSFLFIVFIMYGQKLVYIQNTRFMYCITSFT